MIPFAEWCHHMHEVQYALSRLSDSFEPHVVRDAFVAVLALAEVLDGAYSDDGRTATTLELTQLAIDELLDALAPWVPCQDCDVVGGASLATALASALSSTDVCA